MKGSQHTDMNDDISSNCELNRYEWLFNPYIICRQPIVTHALSNRNDKMMNPDTQHAVIEISTKAVDNRWQAYKDQDGIVMTRHSRVIHRAYRLTL